MNYRHIYHAGSFSDVFKHIMLIILLTEILSKDKPCFYLDTHAGIGEYDLNSKEAQKSPEYLHGIVQVIKCASSQLSPKAIQTYINLITALNENKKKINLN